ncbi:Sterol 24-C-methyltransferase [Handroanthus impetiginosus]|uniref:Sterol 24-C-methyltransferase n=1 Tax=Handroanthus impetiginosus TaxID=429701 RepID=A0A2G9HGS1_9LAMI|nr:Sterol 24-C-methyltransferase [Handroanthus impetiginosus]
MATGKFRGSKRSSGTTSYSTTIVVFVALSILLIWLLTSNSISPPQSTTRASTKSPKQITSIAHSHHSLPQVIHPDHEDIPTQLSDDPIKPLDPSRPNEIQETQDDKKDASSNSDTSNNRDSSGGKGDEEKQEVKTQKNDIKTEANPNKMEGKESVEEEEKQIALETQTSEESSGTQKQQVEQTAEDTKQMVKNDHNQEGNEKSDSEETKVDGSEITQNHITDDDQQQRIEEHQKQEDDQIQQQGQSNDPLGAISHDQIQHDEASIHSVEDQVTNQEIKYDSVDERRNLTSLNQKMNQEELAMRNDDASFPNGESSGIPKESTESKKSWSTQGDQSENQNERRKAGSKDKDNDSYGNKWQLCNVTAGTDYIPCLDNEKEIAKLHSRKHYEHRERHCPKEPPTCLVPLPKGYKRPIDWPLSRDKIWYSNVPHTLLAEVKGHQNWVKLSGEFLTFPGGGTQFIHGALHYIDFLQEAVPDIAWGKHSRVVLDVGCGVASFGGYLFDRDVLTMSFAPKDEHEAQIQLALERGIPAISAVMGSQRLPFPSRVFDLVHCARCRVPWHADGGALLLELNRVLRPGGYFVWSATPVYQKLKEDVEIWKEMSNLTVAMCWELVTIKKDKMNSIGAAIYQKPDTNDCYERRKPNHPPICKSDDDPNAAWYVPLQSCMHRVPIQENERGSQWPEEWPERMETPPYWLNKSHMGIYGKPAPDDFVSDYEHWKEMVSKSYTHGLGISWSNVRNVMDTRAVYGGFAAALKDLKVWVMNVVNVDSPDTLPIIYERGLFGIYHDWCESFSTYPRTYDLLHADHLFSRLKKRCKLEIVMAEMDRIVRPGGKLIVRDESITIGEVEKLLKSLHWEVYLNFSKNQEGILSAQKSDWRPDSYAPPS